MSRTNVRFGVFFMILWLSGAFGAGKTTVAHELAWRLPGAFIYDPEEVGYFLRKNLPAAMDRPDFQDIPLWRELNYPILATLSREHPGPVIVPMTLVNEDYCRVLPGRLAGEGIGLVHVILSARRETLVKRLRKRNLGWLNREAFALDAMDRCLAFFAEGRWGVPVETDGKPVGRVVEEVAALTGLSLLPEDRSPLRQRLARAAVWRAHIR